MPTGLKQLAHSKGYPYERHIFLCTAQGPCTNGASAEVLWEHLKARLLELQPNMAEAKVGRSRSGCLRICANGPVAIVYPEGTMYHSLTIKKLDKIITEHLIGGKIVEEYCFLRGDEA